MSHFHDKLQLDNPTILAKRVSFNTTRNCYTKYTLEHRMVCAKGVSISIIDLLEIVIEYTQLEIKRFEQNAFQSTLLIFSKTICTRKYVV